MNEFLQQFWPWVVAALNLLVAVVASSHAVLQKRDSKAAAGWVGMIWFAPIVGSLLYVWLGVNRIQRRAIRLRPAQSERELRDCALNVVETSSGFESRCRHLLPLAALVQRVTGQTLREGNSITPLQNGDVAFARMISAIENATKSVTLCTYIFDNDRAGRAFAVSLKRAAERGVEVRVLVDDLGSRYGWPSGVGLLVAAGIKVARFLPTWALWQFQYSNLRNHRKIMVVDGSVGFTGGMNIREGNYQAAAAKSRIQDIHFELQGPVVHQLQEAFAFDWKFASGEQIEGASWYGPTRSNGKVLARVVSDGPDEELDRLQSVIQGAIACAASRVIIVTPYFIPDYALISALNTAALKGLQVDIVLPSRNDVRLVHWASMATLPQLLDSGCRIWLTLPPFDHSKLMIVDGLWSMIGSANWDQRSLRLNFELNVECYDEEFAVHLTAIAEARIATATRVTPEWFKRRRILARIRDGIARLASPYL